MILSIIERILFPAVRIDSLRLKQAVSGKTILITGASFGIGEALVYLLADRGARLILVARTEEKLIDLKETVEKRGGEAVIFLCDLYEESEVRLLCEKLQALSPSVDVFVSNAGKSIKRSIWDSQDRMQDFTRTININYLSPVQICLSLLPNLVKNKGQIVNISAINVKLPPVPHWSAYQASKVAFEQWLGSIAPELAGKEIVCTNIYLPLVRTRMIAPTKIYENMPAMQPERVAKIIAKSIYKRQLSFEPWWIFFMQIGISVLRPFWRFLYRFYH